MQPPDPARRDNPLLELSQLGQSIWLDFIRRDLVTRGELARLVRDDGIRGVTSNPAIFEKAIASSDEYNEQIVAVAGAGGDARQVYESLAIEDIRGAADALSGVYAATEGGDGFVSLEVAPDLAHETTATIEEARRLWREVDRPNLMVKVPGTPQGLPAIRRLLAEGINVNVTLLFSRHVYREVADIHAEALEERIERGLPIDHVASVASFFVSRIDTLIDAGLDERIASAASEAERDHLRSLQGRVAVANAKLAYLHFRDLVASSRWHRLAGRGGRPQRLLWASTSTKNPAYRDTLYVEELIGPQTVNTVPPETLDAFRDHGRARLTLDKGVHEADAVLTALAAAGLDLDAATERLLDEGVRKFVQPFESLLQTIDQRSLQLTGRSR